MTSSESAPCLEPQASCLFNIVEVWTVTAVRVCQPGRATSELGRAAPQVSHSHLGSQRRAFLASHATSPALSESCLCWMGTNGGRFRQADLMKALETSADVEPKPPSPASGS